MTLLDAARQINDNCNDGMRALRENFTPDNITPYLQNIFVGYDVKHIGTGRDSYYFEISDIVVEIKLTHLNNVFCSILFMPNERCINAGGCRICYLSLSTLAAVVDKNPTANFESRNIIDMLVSQGGLISAPIRS